MGGCGHSFGSGACRTGTDQYLPRNDAAQVTSGAVWMGAHWRGVERTPSTTCHAKRRACRSRDSALTRRLSSIHGRRDPFVWLARTHGSGILDGTPCRMGMVGTRGQSLTTHGNAALLTLLQTAHAGRTIALL